jgi:localization factor PodJL
MRAELPWNVAGIPPEAREAARAAARREGLSVGEWLTRHILHDFSETGDAIAATPEGAAPIADKSTGTAEATPHDAWRRVEEQLRGIGRRLDSSERSHSESNRFLSRTAQEMNASTREQAQAFDHLGQTVSSLRERLERLERSAPGSNIREAIKALHLGLSRLAEQLTVTAGNSAGQLAALNQRIDVAQTELAQRLQDSERMLGARLSAAEKTTLFNTNALDHALEKIEAAAGARAAELAESQRRATRQEEDLREVKDTLEQLESRLPGLKLETRLNGIERTIGGLKETIGQRDPALAFSAAVQELTQRLERLERDQAGLTEDSQATPHAALELPPEFSEPLVEVPPHLEKPAEDAPVVETPDTSEPDVTMPAFFYASQPEDAIAAEETRETGAPRDRLNPPAQDEDPDILFRDIVVESNPDALLAEARRSAQVALERADHERIDRLSAFHSRQLEIALEDEKRPRYWIPLAAVLVVALVASAALIMSQRAKRLGEQLAAATPATDKIPVLPSLPAGQPMAPAAEAPAGEPDGDQTAEIPPASHRIDSTAAPADANKTATIATAEAPRSVARKTAAGPDRVVQLANAGNPIALTILGIRALDGSGGTTVNLPDAVKFLTQAADKGQAVAQYRLGTLYERGQGVAADPAKAMHLYELAADQGNRKAMHNLAVAYASGPAAKRNMTLAARWFAKAAVLGLADSQFNLAVLYERGEGVPQSLSDAYKWYDIAALSGDGEAKARLAVLDTQLGESERAAAGRSAASFHASPLIRGVNVPPEPADLGT